MPSIVSRTSPAALRLSPAILTALVCGLLSSTAGGQEKEPDNAVRIEQFKRSYHATLPSLIGRYSINRKIRYRHTTYAIEPDDDRKIGDVVSTSVNELITDGQRIKLVVLEATPDDLTDTHHFWRPDVQFSVTRNDGRYEITDLIRPNSRNYSHESAKYEFFAHEPTRAGGNVVGTSLWYEDFGTRGPLIAIEQVRETTWRGKKCLEVRSRWNIGNKQFEEVSSTYLDPDNQHLTIGTETDWRTHATIETRYRIVDEIEYQPSRELFLFPKSSRRFLQGEDGTNRKVHDVEFLAYDYYEPKQDEFQLEGRYQLTTPYLSPPPVTRAPLGFGGERRPVGTAGANQSAPSPSLEKARRWGVLAAMAALAAGVIVVVRQTTRRPTKRP